MRILQVSSARTLGGGERHLADLSRWLSDHGHDIHVALRVGSPLRAQLSGLPPQNLLETRLRNAFDIAAARRLAGFIRRNEIEIVHAHLARDYPVAAFAVNLARRSRLVLTRHVLFPLNRMHRWTFNRAAGVIAVSAATARVLSQHDIVSKERIRIIHNGVDTDRFRPQISVRESPPGLPAGARFIIGAVGQLVPAKGHEDFIRAAALVARRHESAHFVIAGEDHSAGTGCRSHLRALIEGLGLGGRVHLLGFRDDVPALLQRFDLFVSATRFESFGLAILEAMASGAPVVATRSEGALEIIDDGVTGILVPIGEPDALAAAITAVLDDDVKRIAIRERALAEVRSRFSLERMITATEQVYREALAN